MDLQLKDQIAGVTGGSKGIGLAVTRSLLAEGARVAVVSRSWNAELDTLDGEFVHVATDLMTPEGPSAAIAAALDRFGGIDILATRGARRPERRCPGSDF